LRNRRSSQAEPLFSRARLRLFNLVAALSPLLCMATALFSRSADQPFTALPGRRSV
jgi:hypothetical protein